ncbi:hypothetical protein [Chitinimonas arctica]|uniref:hypothetical protein n=1 Tax=Chitinimonas arctica TaxID=2594795 RepID=UPI001CC3358C|nr:hypothetical protein [Chitinimonas arctica]
MDLQAKYGDQQLEHIIDQAMIYQCACPAQVARLMLALREVNAYEQMCLSRDDAPLRETHHLIADATAEAHAKLQECLDCVMDLEGWDKSLMTMPEALRKIQGQELRRWLDGRRSGNEGR